MKEICFFGLRIDTLISHGFDDFLSLEAFDKHYTLHDSCWMGMYNDMHYSQNFFAVFEWCPHFIPDHIKEAYQDEKIYVVIKLEGVDSFLSTTTFSLGEISPMEVSRIDLTNEEKISTLTIKDIYGGSIRVKYGGKSFVGLFDEEGMTLRN